MTTGATFPFLHEVDTGELSTHEWAAQNQSWVEQQLIEKGVLLIRGLNISGVKGFSDLLETLFNDKLMSYTYRSTPRKEVSSNIYTATEYHSNQVISQHNENAYANKWAMRLGFFCVQPSISGGQTPVADSRLIYHSIPCEIRAEFEAKGIKYIRNYSDVDLPWTEVFGTQDKAEVERFCTSNQLQFKWLDNDKLRTAQVNPAVQIHPYTQEKVWFNQAHLFHVSNLEPHVANTLLNTVGEENLPRNTYFGDGSPIDGAYLDIIRSTIIEHKLSFDWQKGDLMLLDNMLFTHGREAFEGRRKVLVGMARENSVMV